MSDQWPEWLQQVKGYVRAVAERADAPRRVVITNGDWLILFTDPCGFLLADPPGHADTILAFADRSELEVRYDELLRHLDYDEVRGTPRMVPAAALRFWVAPDQVRWVVRGLRLAYRVVPTMGGKRPEMEAKPVVLLGARGHRWVEVCQDDCSFELRVPSDVHDHLEAVRGKADELLRAIARSLGLAQQPTRLGEHYADPGRFDGLPGVAELRHDGAGEYTEYRVLTGNLAHFFQHEPSVSGCRFHSWQTCASASAEAGANAIVQPSPTAPRSFFTDGAHQHCARADVRTQKAAQISPGNRHLCGCRSGRDGDAFCEIAAFEERLCCRVCAFEEVCTASSVFVLPCGHHAVQA